MFHVVAQKVANRIEHTRRASALSREQVAVELGVSARTIYRWERGDTFVPDEHKLAMAGMFGVTVPWLMGWVGLDGNNNEHATEAA
jgi:transcriptional regulator with XRE-family HTH domain